MTIRISFTLVALALLAACGSDKPTENKSPASITPTAVTSDRQAGVSRSLGDSLEVKVTTAAGAASVGTTVTWAVTGGGGSIAPSTSVTNSSGIARAMWTLGSTKGANTATASVAGVTTPATFTATGLESFKATLNGANEKPTATTTGATAIADFLLSPNGDTVKYTVNVNGLSAAPSGLHIHGPAPTTANAGVIENLGFTAGVQTGLVSSGSFNRNSSNFATAAVKYDSLLVLMRGGNTYVNIHSSPNYTAGEIRGQITQP